jgi:hypothetical protein
MHSEMRIPTLDMSEPITTFLAGVGKAVSLFGGSGITFLFAQTLPDEQSLIKAASAVTGWALAVCCIWTLTKTVKVLFEKMETLRKEHAEEIEKKDETIALLHDEAIRKAESRSAEVLAELKAINRNVQK